MTTEIGGVANWDALYAEYRALWTRALAEDQPPERFEPPLPYVHRLAHPAAADVIWLSDALRQEGQWPEGRKWFVAALAERSSSLAEDLFSPMLDAAVDEVNPSCNRYFVEPCMIAFGARRVNEYLLRVLESGTDYRKAGAVNALYWAQVGLIFRGNTPSFNIEYATPESRMAYEALDDIWKRKSCLFLETFVSNSSVDVRRSIIASLNLDQGRYSAKWRPLVVKVIEIARAHEDEYIRHRVEIQLGTAALLAPLPRRRKPDRTQ